jgi:hypothetical protein
VVGLKAILLEDRFYNKLNIDKHLKEYCTGYVLAAYDEIYHNILVYRILFMVNSSLVKQRDISGTV